MRTDHFNLEDPSAVEVWTRSLGITEADLRRAVQAVGTEVGALYDHIQRMKAASNDPMGNNPMGKAA
jgi:hypothetical protein